MSDKIDWFKVTAQRVHGKPANWDWCQADADKGPPGFTRLRGAIPVGTYKSGPRAGRPKWPKSSELETLWISADDMKETKRLYEEATGNCHRCEGNGQERIGWSSVDGIKYQQCSRCNGSGKSASNSVPSIGSSDE